MFKEKQNKTQKGLSLYLAVVIMTIILAIGFGLSALFLTETKMVREMGYSVIAFDAADTGIEKALYEDATSTYYATGTLDGSDYEVEGLDPEVEENCTTSANYCINSVGIYKEVRRKIQVTR